VAGIKKNGLVVKHSKDSRNGAFLTDDLANIEQGGEDIEGLTEAGGVVVVVDTSKIPQGKIRFDYEYYGGVTKAAALKKMAKNGELYHVGYSTESIPPSAIKKIVPLSKFEPELPEEPELTPEQAKKDAKLYDALYGRGKWEADLPDVAKAAGRVERSVGRSKVEEEVFKAEQLAAKTGVRPEWLDRPTVFKSSMTTGGKKLSQSAVNWRKVEPGTEPGRLEKIKSAWAQERDKLTGFASWDRVSKASGVPVEEIASEIKHLQINNPKALGFTVDRAGNNTYFKFKEAK
jgi:hypothetical protein